jgi:hypothetical protein
MKKVHENADRSGGGEESARIAANARGDMADGMEVV